MDWLAHEVSPHSCLLVNTSIAVSCTNLDSPAFELSFDPDALLKHNPQLILDRTMLVKLEDGLPSSTEYFFEFSLYNQVENISKISSSMELYLISKDGLVYEENMNFGPVVYRPPLTNLLDVSVLTDLSQNTPGTLSTLKI